MLIVSSVDPGCVGSVDSIVDPGDVLYTIGRICRKLIATSCLFDPLLQNLKS